jgi:hypothetical protein
MWKGGRSSPPARVSTLSLLLALEATAVGAPQLVPSVPDLALSRPAAAGYSEQPPAAEGAAPSAFTLPPCEHPCTLINAEAVD